MSPTVAFVICTEKGLLEEKSLMFVRSLRQFGGRLANAPVYSYAPRYEKNISKETWSEFLKMEVEHLHLPRLNGEFGGYPLANKPFSLEHAERWCKEDILVLCDSDQLILNEPSALLETEAGSIQLRPVDLRGIGIDSEEGIEFLYWKRLYEICHTGQTPQWAIESTVGQEWMWPYWNSGLVPVWRKVGLGRAWSINLRTVLREGLTPKDGKFFVEQSCLTTTVVGIKLETRCFPWGYNYPIHFQHRLRPPYLIRDMDELVTVHYHDILNKELKAGEGLGEMIRRIYEVLVR